MEGTSESGDGTEARRSGPGAGAVPELVAGGGRDLPGVARLWARSLGPSALVVLAGAVAMLVALVPLYIWAANAALALGFADEARSTPRQLTQLMVAILVPMAIVLAFISATVAGGVAVVAARTAQGERAHPLGAFRSGLRSAPRLVVVLTAVIGGVLLAFVATPFLVLVGIVGLVLTPLVRLAQRRWERLPWPATRILVVVAIPFGLAAALLIRWTLALPAVAVERRSIRGAFVRSAELARSQAARIAVVAVVFFLAPMVVVSLINTQVVVDATSVVGPQLWSTVAGVFLLTLGVAAMTYLFLQLGGPADLALVEAPAPGRNRSVGALVVFAVMAAAVPVGLALQRSAPAAAAGGATIVVDDLGDEPDADAGDGTCATEAGTCTLRAAMGEANQTSDEVIGFAVSGTVTVGSMLRIQSPMTIDGSGRRVTVSGGGTVSILSVQVERPDASPSTIRSLTLADGFDGSTGGAAIFNSSAGGGLVLDGVTVRDNTAAEGAMFGGAVVNASTLTVRNSTFSSNDAGSTTDGSDLSNVFSGSATISQSTFTGSTGASAVSSSGDNPAAITNSIVSGYSFGCSGTFTGSGNVTVDPSARCPGTFGVAAGSLDLAPLADNGGSTDTVRLLPGSPAVDAGGAAACTATDQRGATRPKGSGCDAGAYELDPATATTLTATPETAPFGTSVTLEASVTATGEPVVPTGKVELFDGATSLGTVDLDRDGTASKVVASFGAGAHQLTAVYRPAAGLASSTSAARTVTIERAAATVALTSSGTPTGGGDAVTFRVEVTSGAGVVPGGTVTVRDGAAGIATVPLDGAGKAEVVTSTLAGGPHVIVADYSGDANHAPVSSAPLGHEVVGGSTTVLRPPAGPTVYGNGAVFEVEVSALGGGATPTGGVVLVSGAAIVGSGDLGGDGTVRITSTTLEPGTNSVVAIYGGDGFNGSSSSAAVTHQVSAAETTTRLGLVPSTSSVYGTDLALDLEVTAAGTPAVPSGTVTIYDGSSVVTAVVLEPDGTSDLKLPVLPARTYALRAEFNGPAGFRSSTSAVIGHEVRLATTAVALAASSPSSVTGEQVTLTATVTSTDSPQRPVGNVTFRDGSTVLGSAPVDATGSAQLDTRAIGLGTRRLTATFDGSGNFQAKTSPDRTHTVAAADTRVSIVASPGRSWFGATVTIDVVVTAVAPGSGTPAGRVTIRDGAQVLGAPDLDSSGRTSIAVGTIAVGQRTIRADYAGGGGFRESSATTTQTVDPDTTTVTVLTSDPDLRFGRPVTLTAAVLGTGSAKPTGSVTFTGSGRALGSAPIDATGRADLTVTSLPVGSVVIEAAYAGDGNFTAGTGVLVQRVEIASTATSLTVSPAAPTVADVVTLTATVTGPGASVTPSGSVGFYDNDVLLATEPIDATGQATLRRTFDRSFHELQARFVASPSWQGSASSRTTIVPTRVGGLLTVTATPTSTVIGGPVTLRASVSTEPGVAAPTGVIHFTDASGALGSQPLVDGVATLSVPAPSTPGPWVVNGWYPGDANYESVAPTAATVTVETAATAVTVAASPNPGFALDGPVTVQAHVTSGYGGAPITGTVRFTSDGAVLTSELAPVDARGFAEITIRDLPAGTLQVRAEYLPTSGSAFSGSSGTTTHTAVKRSSRVEITGTTGLRAGRSTQVSVSVLDPLGSGYLPRGAVRIDAGNGISCTAAAPTGSCNVVLPATGPVTFTAIYDGDDRFLGDDASLTALVAASTPTLRASSPTRTWVTGDPIVVDWTLGGPTSGTVTVRSPFGVACTVPAAASGSCTATIPFEERGAAFAFDVAYSGDATWDPATTSVDGTLRGCFPVPFTAQPEAGGTVTGPDGTCNDGAGFVDGTRVTAVAEPAPGYVLDRWIETDRTALDYGFVVGESTRSATAVFELDCVTLTYRSGQSPDVDPVGSAGGRIDLSRPSDCGVADSFDASTGTTTARLRRGATIDATAVAAAPERGQFKGWALADRYGNTTYRSEDTIELPLDDDLDLTANFGTRCYQPEVTAEGAGTARIATAPNCIDAFRGSGFVFGTPVQLEGTPDAFHFTEGMRTLAGAFVDPAAFPIRSDDPVIVRFEPCRQLTTASTGSGRGTVQVSEPSTCPGEEPGWYVPGEITLQPVANPGYLGKMGLPVEPDEFKRWIDEDGVAISDRADPLTLDMRQDRRITAVFTSPSRCATVTLQTDAPEWIGGLRIVQDPANECDGPNEYLQGEPLVLTSDALQGSPLIQWKATGLQDYLSAAMSGRNDKIPDRTAYGSQVSGSPARVTKMYGDVTATAYACSAINSEISLVDDDGGALRDAAPDGFVRFDLAPTCPGTGNGWRVGDTVGFFAGAQPVGYEFLRWEGDVPGDDITGEVTLDGIRPLTTLRPVYRVKCYSLAVTPEANTVRGADPNCPGADPAENRYVGGTTVALHAFDGGEVWVGWEGDVARSQNPSWAILTKDSTANAKWRDKSLNEDIKDFFTDVGNGLAVGAKKLVGVAILAANALLDSTFTAVMGAISLVATAIDAIAGALGAPSSGDFREVISGIQQTANLFASPFSCGSEWAFADSRDAQQGIDLEGDGGDLKDLIKDPKKLKAKIDAYGEAIGEIDGKIAALEDGASNWSLAKDKFMVRAGVAKSGATAALTVVGIGTSIASGGFGWESTADEAWGSESGRQFMNCMQESYPDYWGVPPVDHGGE